MSCAHAVLRSLNGGRCPACPAVQPFASARSISDAFKTFRSDGWQNVATGLGTMSDKRTAGGLVLSVVSAMEARDLWRGNDLAAKVIELAAKEELRNGFELKFEDKDLAEKVMAALEEIPGPAWIGKGWKANFLKARCFENAYGGGAVFPVINDAAGSLAEPLDEGRIGKIERLQVFEPRELRPSRKYTEGPKYGEISHYQVMPIGGGTTDGEAFLEIHESRLIVFPGIRVTREDVQGVEYGWGDNKLTRVRDVLNDFELTFGSAANLLQDFSQAVLKLENLAEVLGADGGGEASARLSEMNRWRSMLRAIVIDGKDSFTRETTNLTGMPDMLDRFMYRLSAASGIPVTKLMGMAPAGLNATGESDNDNWDDEVSTGQEHITPMIERLIKLFMLSSESPTRGKEPGVWSIEWCPLEQPSAKEQAETEKIIADKDAIYLDRGVYSAEECARARFGGDTFSGGMSIDFAEMDAARAEAARAANSNAAGAPNAPPAKALDEDSVKLILAIVESASSKKAPVSAARAIFQLAFPALASKANEIIPDELDKPAAPAVPFGGAQTPPAQTPPEKPVDEQADPEAA